MVLGAFVDAGVSIDELQKAIAVLPLSGYTLAAREVKRCGVRGTQVLVECERGRHHRTYADIRAMISQAQLPPKTKENALKCFHILAEAEGQVHGIAHEEVHFHEVGAVDSIIDIVGAMWCAEYLQIERFLASEVVVGSGTVQSAHGELPVPAPATALLLQGVPTVMGGCPGERTTPTGAAILRTLVSDYGKSFSLRISRVGYGAGSREEKGRANYLRIFLGEAVEPVLPLEHQTLALIQTEIDDMSGEQFGFLQERLFESGVLDVCLTSVQMKKNRPGTSVQILVAPENVHAILEVLLRESSTFGAKVLQCDRYCLPRESHVISTRLGPIRVKVGFWGSEVLKVAPEYEDCRKLAKEKGLPLARVFEEAMLAASHWLEERWEQGVFPIE